MTSKSTRVIHGGACYAVVMGLRDGKGITRLAQFPIADNTVMSDDEILNDQQFADIRERRVVDKWTYFTVSEQTDFGYAMGDTSPMIRQSVPPSTGQMISQKEVHAEQPGRTTVKVNRNAATATGFTANQEGQTVSEKAVFAVQPGAGPEVIPN